MQEGFQHVSGYERTDPADKLFFIPSIIHLVRFCIVRVNGISIPMRKSTMRPVGIKTESFYNEKLRVAMINGQGLLLPLICIKFGRSILLT